MSTISFMMEYNYASKLIEQKNCLGAGLVASASYSKDCAVFEPGAKHTFDEGVGESS